MNEFFERALNDLINRASGAMKLRLILQPLIAIYFAIRAGKRDAKQNRPPFLLEYYTHFKKRRELFKSAWKDIGKVFIVAFILDCIYQKIALTDFYPGEALVAALILAVIPYGLMRAFTTRFSKRVNKL